MRAGDNVHGLLSDLRPEPDCEECARLAGDRATARAQHNPSGVSDANVLLRRHQRNAHPE